MRNQRGFGWMLSGCGLAVVAIAACCGLATQASAQCEWKFVPDFGSGFNNDVNGLAEMSNGDIIACGKFTTAGGKPVKKGIARWDGTEWWPLGNGPSIQNVEVLVVMPSGDLLAGTPSTPNGIDRWDGEQWTQFLASTSIYAMTVMPNGDLVVGGTGNLARWNGVGWFPITGLGSAWGPYTVMELCALPNGDVVVGGGFNKAGGNNASGLARWDGMQWWSVPNGSQSCSGLAPIGNNGVVVANTVGVGCWVPNGNCKMWASGYPTTAVAVVSSGEVFVAGGFDELNSQPMNYLARWNGTSWVEVDGGLGSPSLTLMKLANGDVVVGGKFSTAGSLNASRIARLRCEPVACAADCDGSGVLEINDFVCFQTNFALGSLSSDCDASGSLDIDDFVCFQTLFAVGC